MTSLATNQIATITELREPQKVFDRACGKPIAILKNSALISYFVPVEAMPDPDDYRVATMDEVVEILDRTRATVQPVLDYLKDK